MIHATRARSVVKTVLWRLLSTLITFTVIFFFTGEIAESVRITVIVAVISMVGYYFHERAWDGVEWGRNGECDDRTRVRKY